MKTADIVNGKRILIWGYGMEGKSMERFLKTHADPKTCTIYQGPQDGIDEDAYDLILKSPGIVANIENSKYSSMTELFLAEFAPQTVGVTGTKGKSTTVSMLYEVLSKTTGRPVVLVGNIGMPCLDHYDEIEKDTVILFEMSCHQLDHIKCSPHIAVFLNLFPEHLDHYGTMERYTQAKLGITKNQTENDFLLTGEAMGPVDTKAKTIVVPETSGETFDLQLAGEHNQFNARIVHTLCTELFGCEDGQVRQALREFKGLSHRMEYIGTLGGVAYYDDSISTIPEATIAAAGSIKNAQTLLIGGMDRNIPYDVLIGFVRNHPEYRYIFMYASGKRIYDSLTDLAGCYYREDLKEAVALAKELTKEGEACILSPAAASYGYFKNFEERGDVFRQLVFKKE